MYHKNGDDNNNDNDDKKKYNSNLLHRITNFLPQIDAANQELETRKKSSVIDLGLVQDNGTEDDDDDDDDDDHDNNDNDDDKGEGEAKDTLPVIQLKVQFGDMEQNKQVFDLLLPKDDDSNAEQELTTGRSSSSKDNEVCSDKEHAIATLLLKENEEKLSKKRKIWIEEVK